MFTLKAIHLTEVKSTLYHILTVFLLGFANPLSWAIEIPPIPNDTTVNDKVGFNTMVDYLELVKREQQSNYQSETTRKNLLKYAKSGLEWATQHGDSNAINLAKFYAVRYHFDLYQYDLALPLAIELVGSKQFREDPNVIKVTSYIKRIYLNLYAYDELLKFYPIYYDLNKKHGRVVDKSDYINDSYLANAFYHQKNYKGAIVHYKKFANNLNADSQLLNIAGAYNDIALCFKNLNQWDSALFYFNKSLHFINSNQRKLDQNSFDYFQHIVESNKADYFVFIGQQNKALPYYQKELEASLENSDGNIILSAYYNLAYVNFLNGQYDKALRNIDSSMQYSLRKAEYRVKLYHLKAMCQAAKGNTKIATQLFLQESKLKDSIELNRIKNNYIISSIQYDVARKENDLRLSNEKIKAERNKSYYQMIGLIVLAILAMVLYAFYQKAMKDKKTIFLQKKNAENEAQEKSILLKEIHHRVKNNLQVISGLLDLQNVKLNDEKYNEAVLETQRYIQSMSLVHEMLYQKKQISQIVIQTYFEKLSKLSIQGQYKKDIDLSVNAQNITLPIDRAMPLGLMLSELISNSFKHAFKEDNQGIIEISVKEYEAKKYLFEYRDNGIGLANDFNWKDSKSLGFTLLNLFSEEIRGELSIKSENGIYLCLYFNL